MSDGHSDEPRAIWPRLALAAWEAVVCEWEDRGHDFACDFVHRLERFGRRVQGDIWEERPENSETGREVVARLRPVALRMIQQRDWTGLLLLSSSSYRIEVREVIAEFLTIDEQRSVDEFFAFAGVVDAN